MKEYGPEFFFAQQPVGLFCNGLWPSSDGIYEYEPYRGPGHYYLQKELDSNRVAGCYYDRNGVRVSFSVLACSENGFLQLAAFRTDELKP